MSLVKRLKTNRYFKIGLLIFAIGSGPLILVGMAATLGITNDPNPNPVVFGIMAMVTFWPGLALMALGLVTSYRDEKAERE